MTSEMKPTAAPTIRRREAIALLASIGLAGCGARSDGQDTATDPGAGGGDSGSCAADTSGATEAVVTGTFVHPGVLHTADDFKRMADKLAANASPWLDGFGPLNSAVVGMSGWSSLATATITRSSAGGSNFNLLATDVGRAYACALYWKATGSTAHADKALYYMNTWSATLQTATGNIDAFLLSLNAYQFANVGEIMRTYAGCSATNLSDFGTMLRKFSLLAEEGLYGSLVPLTVYSSWQLSCIAALMAIGVLTDDTAMFNRAVDYFRNGEGNGGIKQAVYHLHPGYLGQTQESGRDQGHNTLSVGLLGVICEMAWNQGIDLYGYDNNRVLAACEYVAKGNYLAPGASGFSPMPFREYRTQGIQHSSFASGSQGAQRNEWAIVYHHYANRRGLAAPHSQAFCNSRVETASDNDMPGFGTLTYSRDGFVGDVAPSGLTHFVSAGVVTLNWWGVHDATSYSVKRSGSACDAYQTIATVSSAEVLTYTEAAPSGTVYYTVTAHTGNGETRPSNHVIVAPPGQLLLQLKFDEAGGSTAFDASGNGRNATLVSGTRVPGRSGGTALSLDGSADYVILADHLVTELGDCTIALWTLWRASANREYLFSLGNGNDQFLVFCPQWSNGMARMLISSNGRDGGYDVGTSARLPSSPQWVHVAITVSADAVVLYYDGIEQARMSSTILPCHWGGTKKNWLGRWGDNRYTGLIQDFRIYHSAMPAAGVAALFSSS
jgi:hypothetical protein